MSNAVKIVDICMKKVPSRSLLGSLFTQKKEIMAREIERERDLYIM